MNLCSYIIHILFIWTLVYQFFSKGKQIIIDKISWRLPLLFTVNTLYIISWAIQFYIFAFILTVLSALLTTVSYLPRSYTLVVTDVRCSAYTIPSSKGTATTITSPNSLLYTSLSLSFMLGTSLQWSSRYAM